LVAVELVAAASAVVAWAEVESVVASSVVVVVVAAAGTLAPVERQQPDWLR